MGTKTGTTGSKEQLAGSAQAGLIWEIRSLAVYDACDDNFKKSRATTTGGSLFRPGYTGSEEMDEYMGC